MNAWLNKTRKVRNDWWLAVILFLFMGPFSWPIIRYPFYIVCFYLIGHCVFYMSREPKESK